MRVVNAINVNDAYENGLHLLGQIGHWEDSRAGRVLASPFPVTTVYARPQERVLFAPIRDANPFFHLVEAVWMLAGRSDTLVLDQYVSDFGQRFAEEDGHIHGAYGRRWRTWFHADQLQHVASMLREDHSTRRAVLAMWSVVDDLGATTRDIPCNTHCYFRVCDGALDMLVSCRSNDIIWGAYGANAVHLSVMQEVVAGLAGVPMGRYYQMSFNYHAYESIWTKLKPELVEYYTDRSVVPTPICPKPGNAVEVLADSVILCKLLTDPECDLAATRAKLRSEWMTEIVLPMVRMHQAWKTERVLIDLDQSVDWFRAGTEWIRRRQERIAAREDVRAS